MRAVLWFLRYFEGKKNQCAQRAVYQRTLLIFIGGACVRNSGGVNALHKNLGVGTYGAWGIKIGAWTLDF